MIFRFIGGLAVGGASVVSPMYIAEISPARYRGRLVAFTQFNIVLGILLAYLSNYVIGNLHLGANECRWMFGVMAAPSAVFFVLLFLTPQSPRWLLAKGRVEEARCRAGVRRTHPTTHVPRCLPQGAIIMKSAFAMLTVIVVLTWISTVAQAASPDIVLADFEGKDYGDWKTTGEAFGPGPAQGTLPHQMQVSGYLGHGTGQQLLRRRQVHRHADVAGVQDQAQVHQLPHRRRRLSRQDVHEPARRRQGRPHRDRAEHASRAAASDSAPASWDVSEFAGKTAQDRDRGSAPPAAGGTSTWTRSCRATGKPRCCFSDQKREIVLQKRYLNLPVKNGAPKRRMQRARWTASPCGTSTSSWPTAEPDFWAFMDLSAYKGKTATLQVDRLPEGSRGLAAVEQADADPRRGDRLQREAPPAVPLLARRGWNNDPNGLVYLQGRVSPVLPAQPLRLELGQHALGPRRQPRPGALAGTADRAVPLDDGTAPVLLRQRGGGLEQHGRLPDGRGKGRSSPPSPSTGCGECIAYSNDRGRTWTYCRATPW